MIAACPKCSARYRVDTARVGPEGAKLRCTKCSALFLVRVPAASAEAAPAPAAHPAPTVAPAPAPPAARTAVSADAGPCSVLVADPDAARGKASVDALRGWGLTAQLVHDGVEAMLAIQRMLPRAVVLDAALPRMYGFQICEIVKRNASLRHITVVLVGAVHDQSRYRRDPSDLYGADVFLEQPDLPEGLAPLLQQAGLLPATAGAPVMPAPGAPAGPLRMAGPAPVAGAAPAPAPRPAPPISAPISAPPPAPAPKPAAPVDAAREEERERARRLARIAVSEMLLYHPERFAQACRDGTLERALDVEIQEARALLRQRIGPEVRAEADFVLDELHRVARERGAKA